jgi:CreA protein
MRQRSIRPAAGWALILAASLLLIAGSAGGAEQPDLIFKKSTVFKLLTPNDKLATYAIDDPEVEGVACHFTVPERGGLSGLAGHRRVARIQH